MFFRKPKARNVSEWVEAATRKIAAPANERIRREIEAHYAEAVVAHLDGGLSEGEANAAALAELGDARQAARRFRRQHLTVWEATALEVNDKFAKSKVRLGMYCLLFAKMAFDYAIGFRHFPYPTASIIALFLFLVALPTTAFILSKRRDGFRNGWFSALIRSTNGFRFGVYFLLAFTVYRSTMGDWGNLACRLLLGFYLFSALRLAKKLHGLQDSSDEIPPRDTAVS
jgi:hypothetical protein